MYTTVHSCLNNTILLELIRFGSNTVIIVDLTNIALTTVADILCGLQVHRVNISYNNNISNEKDAFSISLLIILLLLCNISSTTVIGTENFLHTVYPYSTHLAYYDLL